VPFGGYILKFNIKPLGFRPIYIPKTVKFWPKTGLG